MSRRSIEVALLALSLATLLVVLRGCTSGEDRPAQVGAGPGSPGPAEAAASPEVELGAFFKLYSADGAEFEAALTTIERRWRDSYAVMLLEVLRFLGDAPRRERVLQVLVRGTGQAFPDRNAWFDWIWRTNPGTHSDYLQFKGLFYAGVDLRFQEYFRPGRATTIRLDEVRWGGVRRDGIPPLKDPSMIPAPEATYLDETDVVFGVVVNGDARAYPKRILAWHEMVKDRVGGEELCGVYCTLCGSMIVYRADLNDTHHELGTSGFLYRSNKLMYDHATKSLWSTLEGKPVIGPLVGKGIKLEPLQVVTTTWGAWRERHPDTTVLSLETGHERDYSEGAAYRDYFATDELMFAVPEVDDRLANKAEVLAIRIPSREPLAISARFLSEHPVYHEQLEGSGFVVLTDASGANRVYEAGGHRFVSWDGQGAAIDSEERVWSVGEDSLSQEGKELARLPAHRAFWFGWFSAFPNTRLVR